MKKRIITFVLALAFTLILFVQAVPVMAEHSKDASYIYDFWGNANQSLSAFQLATVIDGNNMGNGLDLTTVKDVFVYNNEEIYIVDSTAGRVNIFDTEFSFLSSIRIIRNEEGKIVVSEETNKQMLLNNPEGVYVTDEYIYIADTGNDRVLVLERDTHALVREITKPETMVGDSLFKPSKIAVDHSGRIFIVVQNSTEGIIELNSDGSFSRYYGVNSPTVNLLDYFWRNLASDDQKETMAKIYAPAFSNLHVDHEGFVYAVTLDTASKEMVFRFNSNGENVLRKFGYSEQMGDLAAPMDDSFSMSTFADIAVNEFGVYAVLDTVKNRVFVYNFDGNLLSIFGGKGSTKGTFSTPTSIAWMGNDLIVGDESLASAFVFKTTEFGDLILAAEEKYYTGDFEAAAMLYKDAVEMNANYDHAYVSIGKNLLMQDEYEQSMYYFRLGNDKTYYSTAFMGYRNLIIQKYFFVFAILVVAFIWWVISGEIKYNKQQRKLEEL